ncbi:transcription cofactor vestigial-like protein 4 isoform X1 [Ctenopharyngodon idella]|uniref:transcription cofactor vestigial-like protein 4 isoform X1 n=1 Tax=Ctenopharyngodon idella TaxID=7959 RepID=UPI002231DD9C|nr:transcription cofactor vestigial-like protein 4 isoform X1 [Ctenopharyngodon idella]XP_051736197.1 transcription cofactor vestigial-like protein 4 isoform X1 [Ctenopharyngodon idella]
MDILINRFTNKMNNNISRLHCNPYEDDSGASGVLLNSGCQPVSPTKRKHHENEDSDEEHMNKMRSHLRNPNGEAVNQESWNYSSFGQASLSALHSHHVFTPFPIFAVDQPIEMTKESSDPTRSMLLIPGSGTKPQQVRLAQSEINRPSVITCAPTSNRPCSLSSCHMSPNSCTSGSTNKTNANPECDPVIEEHFRRSLGQIYEEPVPVSNSVSITGSVDDHFTKALGDAWLQIKAKGSGGTAPNQEGRC